MITVTDKFNTAVIYSDNIDAGAEGLIRALCGSPLSQDSRIRVMPDVHAGKGCAVGTTMTITDKAAPGLVGVDIGCGMEALRVTGKRPDMKKLDTVIRENVPSGYAVRREPHRFAEHAKLDELRCARHVQKEKALRSIGTLGGGNHFIELDRSENGDLWLIVHSGSRRLGMEVAQYYHGAAFRQCPEETPYEFAWAEGTLLGDYLHDMTIVTDFAALNRRAVADEIVRGMKWDIEDSFHSIHNYIDTEEMILRKGAVSAKKGERIIIPMNMRDGCLYCIGKGNTEWNCSAPHGAGRLMSRSEAKQSFTLSQYKKEMRGIYSTSVSRDTLDESPMAYKPAEEIMRYIESAADVTERWKPVYNFKAGGE